MNVKMNAECLLVLRSHAVADRVGRTKGFAAGFVFREHWGLPDSTAGPFFY